MVRGLLISLLSVSIAWAEIPNPIPTDGLSLRIEFTKTKAYIGEQLTAAFIIESPQPAIEIEVAKFPEFRGYWSENITLRQGPIALSAVDAYGGRYRGLIGSYLITAMAEASKPDIIPMKVLVRLPQHYGGSQSETYLTSRVPELVLKPLPPIPQALRTLPFTGGVGKFLLQAETLRIPFHSADPVQMRLVLQGEGNFSEINRLPVTLPENVEEVSHRTYTSGNGNYLAKTFETTLSIHRTGDFVISPSSVLTFHPDTGRYETLSIPGVSFVMEPASTPHVVEAEKLELPSPSREWREHQPLHANAIFLWGNGIPLLGLLFAWLLRKGRAMLRTWRTRPSYLRRQLAQAAVGELSRNNTDRFLTMASDVATQVLQEKLDTPSHRYSRAQLLTIARDRKVSDSLVRSAERIFEAEHRFRYSPKRELPSPSDTLRQDLKILVG